MCKLVLLYLKFLYWVKYMQFISVTVRLMNWNVTQLESTARNNPKNVRLGYITTSLLHKIKKANSLQFLVYLLFAVSKFLKTFTYKLKTKCPSSDSSLRLPQYNQKNNHWFTLFEPCWAGNCLPIFVQTTKKLTLEVVWFTSQRKLIPMTRHARFQTRHLYHTLQSAGFVSHPFFECCAISCFFCFSNVISEQNLISGFVQFVWSFLDKNTSRKDFFWQWCFLNFFSEKKIFFLPVFLERYSFCRREMRSEIPESVTFKFSCSNSRRMNEI